MPLFWGMENMEEKTCLCALNRIFGFEPKTALALISHLGSASRVFMLTEKETDTLLGPYSRHKGKICRKALDESADELERLSAMGIQFCGITEEDYPSLLKECKDAPIGLYVRSGTPASALWNGQSVAVVGTRDISPYGKEWCRKLVKGISFTDLRPTIISGLALGVDIEAHRTALEHGLPTIAVMATGPESVYPHRHRETAERIASTPGCALITDYPPGTAPLAIHFLRRNRIIAGLSKATVLVESKIRGGGMMTCTLAFSYDRDVYALPGRADDIRSQGCNELIRKKIAEPITSASSLIEELGMKSVAQPTRISDMERLTRGYSGRISGGDIRLMAQIMSAVRERRGITVEEIGTALGTGYRKAAELAGILEIDGFIVTDLLQRCSINPKIM